MATGRKQAAMASGRAIQKSLPKSSSRPRSKTFELSVSVVTLVLCLATMAGSLWYFGILSSGVWPESSHITLVHTESDADALLARVTDSLNTPFVIVFYSDSCLACRRMKGQYYPAARRSDLPFYAVRYSKQVANLVKHFDIQFVPAVYVVVPSKGSAAISLYRGSFKSDSILKFVQETVVEQQVPLK